MNRTEHLLACMAEECAEIQKAIGKALRFGLNDTAPGSNTTNAQDIAAELNDLIAVTEMLQERGALPQPHNIMPALERKKARVLTFMKYAEERGTLTPEPTT